LFNSFKKIIMKKLLFVLIALFSLSQTQAQKGNGTASIQGFITDLETQDTLPFVNVLLYQNGIQVKGAASNMDGQYKISALKVGVYSLEINFLGYQKQRVDSILVKEAKTTILNIKLKSAAMELQSYEVAAEAIELYDMDISSANMIRSSAVYSVSDKSYGLTRRMPPLPQNTESYNKIKDNQYQKVSRNPLSTFSIDVDRASYTNIRRFINDGTLPPKDAVRIEEMINYFSYDYPQPTSEHPFSITSEYTSCPWNREHKLVHIGIQGKQIQLDESQANNLVFLIDVSGSMSSMNKLGLLKKGMNLLVDNLRAKDKVAIVVYAGAAGLVLPSTSGKNKDEIKDVFMNLEAGGSTAGGAGIELAYKVAKEQFIKNGNNRVILATDGDFNVGISSEEGLVELIEEKRGDGIFLSVLGFGSGNLKDSKMEQLADKGNGNYNYIDNILEAKKVLVTEMGGTLITIAKDVKVQAEFNPMHVQSYRLIGYVNRHLEDEDFNDDLKDAGELGAGHTVTALYEIVPVGVEEKQRKVDSLKYQNIDAEKFFNGYPDEVMTIKFRYKKPDGDKSILITQVVNDNKVPFSQASTNCQFAASVASFGMVLRNSEFKGNSTYTSVARIARSARGEDNEGYRAEFIRLVEMAELL